MLRRHFRPPSPAMVVALVSLLLNFGGITYAAGHSLVLGGSNTSGRATSLTSSTRSGAALLLHSTASGIPAASFKVPHGSQPFTVSSTAKIHNLDADRLDGLHTNAFQPASDAVSIDDFVISLGNQQSWNIGPYFTLEGDCLKQSDGTVSLSLRILNNARGFGTWNSALMGTGLSSQVVPISDEGAILPGADAEVDRVTLPAGTRSIATHAGTLSWTDTTGETITAIYAAEAYADKCSLRGSLTLVP